MLAFSPYLIAIALSWVVAQGAKYIIVAIKHRNFDHFRQLYLSGNMPSAHSATVVSVSLVTGLYNGFGSALFGLSALLAGIVMYDAVMVRRSVGEQGQAIQAIINKGGFEVKIPRSAKGHTPIEVLVGAFVGVVVGVVVFIATR